MNPHPGRASARPQAPVMPVILRGGAWTARHIRNHCLRRHCHVLATTFRRPDMTALRAVCARVFLVLETRSRVFTDLHPTEFNAVPAVVRLVAYAGDWLRSPEDWQPDPTADAHIQWADLLRHLLARYPVPPFLDAAWQRWGPLLHLERDCWCALAQGRNPREIEGFPRNVSNRLLHAALNRAQGRSLAEAIWLAQLHRLGASPSLEKAVLSSRVVMELGNHARWSRLAAKFAAASEDLAGQFELVSDTLAAAQNHRGPEQVEQLLRLPLESLIRHCVRFTTRLLAANGHLLTETQVREAAARAELKKLTASRWIPFLGGEPFASKLGHSRGHATWRVEELHTLDMLREESRVMKHCVDRYAHRCRGGSSAIFSVRHYATDDATHPTGIPHATIEVHPYTRKVVQIRAAQNRPVNNTIMTIIREWSAANELICTG